MRLGLLLPTMQSVDVNRAALRAAEQVGVDDVWVLDHMMGLTHPTIWPLFPAAQALPDPDALLDPFCVAAALGPTTDLPLGTCVTDATRRRGGDLARAALTLHDACRGGFVLGLGSGEAESIVPFGYDYDFPVGNVERALREIRSMLDRGHMPEGVGRTGLPRDGNKGIPEVWVAAQHPRMLRLTGTYADGWLPLPSSVERYREQFGIIKAAATSADRPTPVASLVPATILGDSREQVLQTLEQLPVARLIAYYLPAATWRTYGLDHPGGPDCRGQADIIPHTIEPERLAEIADTIPVELVEELAWLGNADEIAERIAPYAESGATHLLLGDVTGTTYAPEEAARVIGEQLPRLRELLQEL
ncbi:LLM class flavin-dependent oxidoreductase [Mycobacterium sp. Aquia_216]|uniref:LLM class flavin-dependent oxidoreductase n=1 Tax=Mycobacterium sp. Aquia_216 TaxID=2991729 RepID=UPI00227B5C2C|nr:LLM class flavin-dependent oxidoreductase [Mycobacterium sp. Aquia_216]WAJ43378.1 LLM class flavin-dependent oxidoreductase [Mycobacterium sp. Aquia_216]